VGPDGHLKIFAAVAAVSRRGFVLARTRKNRKKSRERNAETQNAKRKKSEARRFFFRCLFDNASFVKK
jgi:hypothetical protein